MFEFHAWVVLTVHDYDDADPALLERHLVELVSDVQAKARELEAFCSIRVARTGDLHFLDAHGRSPQRFDPIIELFRWIARRSTDSYGLLYARDDAASNAFRAWRLARGIVDEQADPFLSPCIPTIQAPFRGSIPSEG